jgi:hypothetical protein
LCQSVFRRVAPLLLSQHLLPGCCFL